MRVIAILTLLSVLQIATPPQAQAGTVSGRVVDENGNPLRGLRVEAAEIGYRYGVRFLSPVATQTDQDGIYRISGLEPGDFVVIIPPSTTSAGQHS